MNPLTRLLPAAATFVLAALPLYAQEAKVATTTAVPPETSTAAAATDAKAGKGILPLPDYTGDFWTCRYLTGDWGGSRTNMANKGVQFTFDFTNTLQSVVTGGRDSGTENGGSFDSLLTLDLMQMGVMDGALIKVRAESRYGNSVNGRSGSLLPANTDAFFPLTDRLDEGIPVTLTDVTYYQFLSEKFGLFLGKLTTLDGDPNEFAGGRGATQFLNGNFVFNPVTGICVPYSTLGGGMVWMPTKHIQVTSVVMNTADSSTQSGFDHVEEGWTSVTEADFQYRLGDLPGGANVSFVYAWANDFKSSGRLVFEPGEGVVAPTDNDTWAVTMSGWQYVYTEEKTEGPLDLTNGRPDLQGIGLFSRIGFADQDTNPIEWTANGGIGGRGVIPGRDNDVFGLGYFYSSVQNSRLLNSAGFEDHTHGLEVFYNLAITPAVGLTFDTQVLESALPNIDTTVILGLRLNVRF